MTSTSKQTPPPDFHLFEAAALARGFQQVISRKWGPNERPPAHSHPFDAEALVVEGEMWLQVEGHIQHLLPGSMFKLPAGTEHDEWYGPEGAVYWVARRAGHG